MVDYLFLCSNDDGHVEIYFTIEDFFKYTKQEVMFSFSIFKKEKNMYRKNSRYEYDYEVNLNEIGCINEVIDQLKDDYGYKNSYPEIILSIIHFFESEVNSLQKKCEESEKQQKERERENAYQQYLKLKEQYGFE